jgi:Rrf2 family protein
MHMAQGVEWALHNCLNLAFVPPSHPVPATLLAELLDAPPAYLTKQLQALAKAGILHSTPGPRGGFSLARDPAEITYLDVVTAIEGPGQSFRCTELRQRGPLRARPEDCTTPCAIAATMWRAEQAWRSELRSQTIRDLQEHLSGLGLDLGDRLREWLDSQRGVRAAPSG